MSLAQEEIGLNTSTTAIVLIEYQNDFTTSGGAFHDAVKGVMQSNGMLGNTIAMVDKARAAGACIMHVPIGFAAGYPELGAHPYGILKGVAENHAFRKGSWGAEIVDALQPKDGDIVIEGKRGLDAFPSTNLDFILRSRGIRTVVLAGFLTNCCVESTMRSAYERGYEVITLTDCTATTSDAAQNSALTHDFGMFSHPMTHVEFMQALA
jgi:nicotinamidase-related amidase